MRVNKKVQAYVRKNLELLREDIAQLRLLQNGVQLQLEGLEKAVHSLPKTDRESIEKFWGLNGGPNHSAKRKRFVAKDVAYIQMRDNAMKSLGKLLTWDYVVMYDTVVSRQINTLAKKFNNGEMDISDIECTKYLMAFFIYADNGPKMGFEEDPMSIDTDLQGNFLFHEYEVLNQMCESFREYPDKSINMQLLISFFEMIDYKDMLTIKKTLGIKISTESLPEGFVLEDIETARTVSKIRLLKEKIFPYGAWNVVTKLILGNEKQKVNLDNLMRELNSIRKNWAKAGEFKVGETTLRTANELRKLNVYNIGGLEFTDIYEVMFLYLERNLIAPEL